MTEYIEKELAKVIINNYGKGAISDGMKHLGCVDDIVALAGAIDLIPAADAVPIVHGAWLDSYNDYQTAECSICGELFEVTFGGESDSEIFDGFKRLYKYCPNCGAKMEG